MSAMCTSHLGVFRSWRRRLLAYSRGDRRTDVVADNDTGSGLSRRNMNRAKVAVHLLDRLVDDIQRWPALDGSRTVAPIPGMCVTSPPSLRRRRTGVGYAEGADQSTATGPSPVEIDGRARKFREDAAICPQLRRQEGRSDAPLIAAVGHLAGVARMSPVLSLRQLGRVVRVDARSGIVAGGMATGHVRYPGRDIREVAPGGVHAGMPHFGGG